MAVDADLRHTSGRLAGGGHVSGADPGLHQVLQVHPSERVVSQLATQHVLVTLLHHVTAEREREGE